MSYFTLNLQKSLASDPRW